jgi:hypothetical protein
MKQDVVVEDYSKDEAEFFFKAGFEFIKTCYDYEYCLTIERHQTELMKVREDFNNKMKLMVAHAKEKNIPLP